jgi:hypothetical protein
MGLEEGSTAGAWLNGRGSVVLGLAANRTICPPVAVEVKQAGRLACPGCLMSGHDIV